MSTPERLSMLRRKATARRDASSFDELIHAGLGDSGWSALWDAHALALLDEIDRLRTALDEAQLHSIEAHNPGIDMDEVRRTRAAPDASSDTEEISLGELIVELAVLAEFVPQKDAECLWQAIRLIGDLRAALTDDGTNDVLAIPASRPLRPESSP